MRGFFLIKIALIIKYKMNIKKTKEKIIESLEGKNKVERLTDEYFEAEQKLCKELHKLESYGEECYCKDREIIRFIHEGNFPEISTLCLNCGGYVDE